MFMAGMMSLFNLMCFIGVSNWNLMFILRWTWQKDVKNWFQLVCGRAVAYKMHLRCMDPVSESWKTNKIYYWNGKYMLLQYKLKCSALKWFGKVSGCCVHLSHQQFAVLELKIQTAISLALLTSQSWNFADCLSHKSRLFHRNFVRFDLILKDLWAI